MRGISQLSVSYINVGSLLAKFEPFLDFTREFRHDVMGITETWLHTGIDSSVVQIDNYKVVRSDRRNRRGGRLLHKIEYKLQSNLFGVS